MNTARQTRLAAVAAAFTLWAGASQASLVTGQASLTDGSGDSFSADVSIDTAEAPYSTTPFGRFLFTASNIAFSGGIFNSPESGGPFNVGFTEYEQSTSLNKSVFAFRDSSNPQTQFVISLGNNFANQNVIGLPTGTFAVGGEFDLTNSFPGTALNYVTFSGTMTLTASTAVPEPTALGLLGLGASALVAARRPRRAR